MKIKDNKSILENASKTNTKTNTEVEGEKTGYQMSIYNFPIELAEAIKKSGIPISTFVKMATRKEAKNQGLID